jgi:hypothetical protein
MVEFSCGFSRVSATTETVQKDRRMPVRLMGFPPLPSNKRPIYVIEQQNEAIYIQLNSAHDGRPRKYLVHVARPKRSVSPLPCGAPRVALRFRDALRSSGRRVPRLHHDSGDFLRRWESAAVARRACRRARAALGRGPDATPWLSRFSTCETNLMA